MKGWVIAVLASVAIAGLPQARAQPASWQGYVRQDASLRSGPDAGYPEVAWVREGESLWIHGCIDDWSWCDVSWYDRRGGEYRG